MLGKKLKIMYICLALIFIVACSLGAFAKDTKQEVVIAFGQDIITFDMHNYRGGQDIIAGNLVYETLVSFDKDNNIVPKLATSWEQIDPLTWKFYLRKGVKFHDGTPFTGEAVKFSIKRCTEGGGGSYTGFIDEVEVVDDYTVILHLKNEFGPALNNLTDVVGAMMNPKFVEEKGKDIVQYACGTGPFKLEEYIPGTRAVFVKNEDYWDKPAKLDRVEFRTIPEESTRVMALMSGEVDIAENPPPHEIANINKDKNLYVYVSPKYRTLYLSFNLEDKNVGGEENKALREAISYAINPQEIIDYLLEGLALPLDKGFIPEGIIKDAFDPSLVRKPDVEKAKQILKEAGIEPGRTVEFWVTRGRYLLDTATGEVIQDQLSKVGINADISVMEMGPMINAMKNLEHQMYQLAWGWTTGDPYQVFYQLFHSSSVWDLSAFKDENLDKLIEEAGTTVDWNKRMELLNKAYKILYDDVSLIPILQYKNIYAANKKVKGFFASPIELPFFVDVYIEE
jgi:peptide/nickel transport system substrate-binding protein